eukprot:2331869-Ditylum_brightwellii.AAC.1
MTATKTDVSSQAPPPPDIDWASKGDNWCPGWNPCPNLFSHHFNPMSPPPTSPPRLLPMVAVSFPSFVGMTMAAAADGSVAAPW